MHKLNLNPKIGMKLRIIKMIRLTWDTIPNKNNESSANLSAGLLII